MRSTKKNRIREGLKKVALLEVNMDIRQDTKRSIW